MSTRLVRARLVDLPIGILQISSLFELSLLHVSLLGTLSVQDSLPSRHSNAHDVAVSQLW